MQNSQPSYSNYRLPLLTQTSFDSFSALTKPLPGCRTLGLIGPGRCASSPSGGRERHNPEASPYSPSSQAPGLCYQSGGLAELTRPCCELLCGGLEAAERRAGGWGQSENLPPPCRAGGELAIGLLAITGHWTSKGRGTSRGIYKLYIEARSKEKSGPDYTNQPTPNHKGDHDDLSTGKSTSQATKV
ncbi:hypothetical protein SRHO_G00266930 [Serrasalmus rhombeus]